MAGNIIYVQGSYIDVHDNETVYLSVDKAEVKMGQQAASGKGEDCRVPDVLTTAEAGLLLARLVDAGLLTGQWKPVNLSCTERGLLAKLVSERLGIGEVWQVFGSLWGEKPETLRSYFNKSYGQRKSLLFQDRVKNAIG